MADNVAITAGSGTTIACDEVADATLGTVKVQYVKIMSGTLDDTAKADVDGNGLQVSVQASVLPTGAAADATLTAMQETNNAKTGMRVYIAKASDGSDLDYTTATDTNLKTVNGTTALSGTGAVGAGAQRVAVAVDSATVAGSASLPAGSNVIGHVIVDSGTVTTVSTVTAVTAITNALPAGTNLIGHVDGAAASGASVSGNPLLNGGRAATASPTAVTDGQAIALQLTETGKLVVSPYAIKENMVRATASGTSGALTLLAAGGASIKTYVTGLQLGTSNAAAGIVTLNDSASSVFIIPAAGGSNIVFPTPLVTAANTALTATITGAGATVYASAQGYYGA